MKIHFLGTSAGWPLPRLGHHCALCDSTDPKDTRMRSSALIGDTILIDAGPDTYQKLLTVDPTRIKYVILTHWHPDHTQGVWELNHIYKGDHKLKPILLSTKPTFETISSHISLKGYHLQEIAYDEIVDLDGVTFQNFQVVHTQGSVGVKLSQDDKTLVYIPDFKVIPPQNHSRIQRADLLVMDGSCLLKTQESDSHQSIETGIELALALKVKAAGFTHIGHKNLPFQELTSYVKTNGGEHFFIPFDGMEVTI